MYCSISWSIKNAIEIKITEISRPIQITIDFRYILAAMLTFLANKC